jgi:hypothetical protein
MNEYSIGDALTLYVIGVLMYVRYSHSHFHIVILIDVSFKITIGSKYNNNSSQI